jgi:hypothetical protein
MVSNYPSAVSKTICVDLLNVSIDELQNLSFIHPIIDTFFSYLHHCHKTLHDDLFNEEHPHLIYLEEDFIIGSRRHGQNYKEMSLGGLDIIPNNNSNQSDYKLFNEIELSLIKNRSLYLTPFLVDCFNSAFKNPIEKESYDTTFINAHLEVSSELALSPEQIRRQYNITTVFLNDKEIKSNDLALNKIYYKDFLPLLFVYIDEDKNEYLSWNKNYLIALEHIKPINGNSIDKEKTLNTILDRINEIGLANLKTEELAFLDYYSKL